MKKNGNDVASNWEEKVTALFKQGRTQESLSVLENAISNCQNDTTALSRYVSILEDIVSNDTPEIRLEMFERAIAMLLGRLAHVSFDNIDDVVRIIDEVRLKRDEIARLIGAQESTFDVDDPLWYCAANGTLEEIYPLNGDQLETFIRGFEILQEKLPEHLSDSEASDNLEVYLKKARLALEFDAAAEQVKVRIDPERLAKQGELAAFSLQNAEAILRNFAEDFEPLDTTRRSNLFGLMNDLKTISEKIGNDAKAAAAESKWQEILKREEKEIDLFLKWKAPWAGYGEGNIEDDMTKIRGLMQRLQEQFPSFFGTPVAQKLASKLTSLGPIYAQMSVEQQKAYDKWALKGIKEGYASGAKHAGFWDNEEEIANSLITHFGPIDIRLLGHEAQTVYGEIFNLLFDRLDKPSRKSDEDFKSKSNKLHALEKMMKTKKQCLADF